MPRCLIEQPNGRYAIWSTVVDDFIAIDGTAAEVIRDEANDGHYANYPGGRDVLLFDLARELVNIANDGRAWKWAPNWAEAIETVRDLHGDDIAERRIKYES